MGTRSELLIGPMAPGRWRQRLSAELMNDMGDLQAASWSPGDHSTSASTPAGVASRATWGRHSPSTFRSYVTVDNIGGRTSPLPAGPASLSAVTTPDIHKSRLASKSPSRISRHGELVYRITAPRSPSPHRTEASPIGNRLSPSPQPLPTPTPPSNKPVAPVACLSARIRALSARCLALLGDRAGSGLRSRRTAKHNTVVKQRSISWGALPGLEAPRQTLTADIDVDKGHDDNESTTVSSTATSTTNSHDTDEVSDDRGLRSSSLDRHLVIPPPVQCTPQRRPGCSETLRIRRSTSPSEISEIFTKFQKRRVSGNTLPESNSTLDSPATTSTTPTSTDTSQDNDVSKPSSDTASSNTSPQEDETSPAQSDTSLPESLPPRHPRRSSQPTPPRSFRLVRLTRSTPDEELGVLIARNETAGFVIAHVLPSGLADRSGQLHAGDELVIVNGRQLRGLSMGAAKSRLRAGPFNVDLLVATPVETAECICKKGEEEKLEPNSNCPRCKGNNNAPKRGRSLTESSVDYENVMIRSQSTQSETHSAVTVVEVTGPREHQRPQLFQKHGTARSCRRSFALSVDSSSSSSSSSRNSPPMHPSLKRQRPRRRSPSGTVSSFTAVAACGVGSAATFVVELRKGPGCAPLGFTVVGGADSPRGELGIFVRSLLEGGQAGANGRLQPGDELLSLNGQVLRGATHAEALAMFRSVKSGPVHLRVCRRASRKSQSCSDLVAGGNKEIEE